MISFLTLKSLFLFSEKIKRLFNVGEGSDQQPGK